QWRLSISPRSGCCHESKKDVIAKIKTNKRQIEIISTSEVGENCSLIRKADKRIDFSASL
ncbi:MAG TPA: hypothetical protein PKV06_12875, partial [bacterium]|nr:hypothetical protein [bacterium]